MNLAAELIIFGFPKITCVFSQECFCTFLRTFGTKNDLFHIENFRFKEQFCSIYRTFNLENKFVRSREHRIWEEIPAHPKKPSAKSICKICHLQNFHLQNLGFG